MPRLRPVRSALVIATVALTAAATLTGCSSTVSMEPAASANDPACAEVMVRLPDTVGGEQRRWTDAQATASWGDPSTVLMTCGLDTVDASTLPCQSAGGVDWLIDESQAPNYRFVSFGREPAIEVYLDNEVVSSRDVLERIGAVADDALSPTGAVCTDRPTD